MHIPYAYRGGEGGGERERFLSLFITCKQVAPSLLGNSIESSANGKNVLEIKICGSGSEDVGGGHEKGKGILFSGVVESQML